jgi:hypothetical protein
MVFPVYHVLAAAAALTGGEVLACESADPLAVEALAVRLDGRLTVLLANLQDGPVEVSLSLPTFVPIHLSVLDETTFELAATEPERFGSSNERSPTPAVL